MSAVTKRDARVDMLRGLALISMFIAHTAPSQGPAGIFEYSEYATAPLFALLIGMGGQLGSRGISGVGTAFIRAGIRAGVLVALGLWLQTLGAQIDIVLVSLALPVIVAPIMALLPTTAVFATAVAAWAAVPVAFAHFTPRKVQALVHHDTLSARLWDVTFTGYNYRGLELLVHLCAGILVIRWVKSGASRANLAAAGGALLALVAAMSFLHKLGRLDIPVYRPERPVTLLCVALVAGFALLWFATVPAKFDIPPLSLAGAMTLSIYALQILYLAWYVTVFKPGHADDSWANVLILSAGALIVAWLWHALVRKEPWRKGPVEGPTALLTGIFR